MNEMCFHDDGFMPEVDRGWIFVFGSNEAGRHGAGAAKAARDHFGAAYGQGRGLTGHAYAIPIKDFNLRSLGLEAIKESVEQFLFYAKLHDEKQFFVTRIGCGLAGYSDYQVGPLFASSPMNCSIPKNWRKYVNKDHSPIMNSKYIAKELILC